MGHQQHGWVALEEALDNIRRRRCPSPEQGQQDPCSPSSSTAQGNNCPAPNLTAPAISCPAHENCTCPHSLQQHQAGTPGPVDSSTELPGMSRKQGMFWRADSFETAKVQVDGQSGTAACSKRHSASQRSTQIQKALSITKIHTDPKGTLHHRDPHRSMEGLRREGTQRQVQQIHGRAEVGRDLLRPGSPTSQKKVSYSTLARAGCAHTAMSCDTHTAVTHMYTHSRVTGDTYTHTRTSKGLLSPFSVFKEPSGAGSVPSLP